MNSVINSISIVMPCFNEEQAIPLVVPRVLKSLEKLKQEAKLSAFELIVVNDQSTDRSAEVLQEYGDIRVIHSFDGPRGYGRALKKGFSQSSGDWIGFLDVDNSYRPEDLPLFIEEISKGQSDFIMGSRAFDEEGMSFTRGFGNWLYVFLAKKIYHSHLEDVCSGYRIFHKKHLSEVLSIPEEGLNFSIHLTLKMLMQKIYIKQIPIQYDERVGPSKLSVFKDGFAFMKILLTLRLRSYRAPKYRRV